MPPKNKRKQELEICWSWISTVKFDEIMREHVECSYGYCVPKLMSGSPSIGVCCDKGAARNRASDFGYTPCLENCRRNSRNNPYCVCCLGFEKLQTGELDYVWSSDEDDNSQMKRSKGSYAGLTNLGATCYVNAFLQLWYHNKAFRNAVFEWKSDNADTSLSLCGNLQFIFGLLELSERRVIDPSPLIEFLCLDANTQQDAQEFSKLFIDLLESQPIRELFCGGYDYVTSCSQCKTESRRPSHFYELDLNIEDHTTLEDALSCFLQVEKLEGENQYFCSACNRKENATRRIQLNRLPSVLNIQLLRFVFDRKTGRKKKLATCIQFPDVLDLSSFVHSSEAHYELAAVLLHNGVTAYSGHYTAHIHKGDSWYKFNDEQVVKLKGKVLKLAAEEAEDCLISGPSPSQPKKQKGTSSKNAYMLVYHRRDFLDSLEETSVSSVPETVVEKVREDNDRFEISNQKTDMKRTELMLKAEMRRDALQEIWTGLPCRNPLENFYVVPLSWLHELLQDWDDVPLLDTSQLLCVHGKLSLSAGSKYKIVSESQGKILYARYAATDTPVLSRASSLCTDCVRSHYRWRRTRLDTEKDVEIMQQLLGQEPHISDRGFWVSRSEFKRWRSLVLKPLETLAIANEKRPPQINENHEADCDGDDKRNEGEQSEAAKTETGVENATESDVNHDHQSPCRDRSGDPGYQFNDEIQCEHGGLDIRVKLRQILPSAVWDILIKYFPNAVTFTFDQEPCELCMKEEQQGSLYEQQQLAIMKEGRKLLSSLAALRNRPDLLCLKTEKVFVISSETYIAWKAFLRNPLSEDALCNISNRSLLCHHGLICIPLSDTNRVVLLWPFEWDILAARFSYDTVITVSPADSGLLRNADINGSNGQETFSSAAHSSYVTSPGICEACLAIYVSRQQIKCHTFDRACIYVRVLDKDIVDIPADNPGDSDECEKLCKRQKAENGALHTAAPTEVSREASSDCRRSVRRRKVRGEKSVEMSSAATLRDLKVELVKLFAIAPFDQKLWLDGNKLCGDNLSLADHKLYPNCTLHIEHECVDENQMEIMLMEQGTAEEGFRGTGLVAAKVCPLSCP